MNKQGEDTVNLLLSGQRIKFEREYKFLPDRKFRFDFAIPSHKIAIEVEGAVWSGGRHVRGTGYNKDCEKYNLAACHGWRVLRYTTDMIRRNPGQVIDDVKLLLKRKI